jgi:hypothetical protein
MWFSNIIRIRTKR